MRRLVVLPARTSAVTAILLAGFMYVAAETRQVVIRHQELELAKLEQNFESGPAARNGAIGESGDRVTGNIRVLTSNSTVLNSDSESARTKERFAQSEINPIPLQPPAGGEHARLIVISVSDRRLALLDNGKLVKTYPIAVGTRWTPSPEGEFTIINHAVDPVYRHKGKEIQPGKDNPLGDRWMGLSLKGYGIHGTNVPTSIGKAVSHGCFRMGRSDVEDLYSRVKVGDRVIIRRERDALIAKLFAPAARPFTGSAGTEDQTASASSTESGNAAVAIVQQ